MSDGRQTTLQHAQKKCCLCEARALFMASSGREPGEETRTVCPDCGFRSTHRVTVVYDPEEYELTDPYGPGDAGVNGA